VKSEIPIQPSIALGQDITVEDMGGTARQIKVFIQNRSFYRESKTKSGYL
jgi:hypothetical protein